MPEAIRHAYCIVVTVSEKNEAQAFKLTVTDAPHFDRIESVVYNKVDTQMENLDAIVKCVNLRRRTLFVG